MHTPLARRSWPVAAILGTALLLAACATPLDEVDPVAGGTTIEVNDNSFGPRVTEVEAGTEITWEWAGNQDHNVVGDGWSSASPVPGRSPAPSRSPEHSTTSARYTAE